ncbi:PaaI family thioesterase [Neptunomonas sp.]|uniref:PaaI family thioesterase n=1 Tax=Neptunomonas sp. TaxID=1971898 RepID=UPI0025F83B49|nr:PaaI family thioesterase [Neptunomonas sp.]
MSPSFIEAKRVFDSAPFITSLGCHLDKLDKGVCHSHIGLNKMHQQQDGYVHAGVQATLADHTAGTAAVTLIEEGQRVLTAEFKINLLRAAQGGQLICRSSVLKPGRMLIIAESEIYTKKVGSGDDDSSLVLVAKATVTLAVTNK